MTKNTAQKQGGKKVAVGMSGGVDSSVSISMLKKEGYDVTGVFIKVWQPDWIECPSRDDRYDAMRVSASLGIPFVTIDLSDTYKKEVVDYMISEYKKGRTPNPDVMCNTHVKFGGFYRWAMANGYDYVATGHYAVSRDGKMCKSKDTEKDQTYFLWNIKNVDMKKILFPVGNMVKSEVRNLAKKVGLYVADKKDSQGLCFIGKIDVKDFLKREIGYTQTVGNVLSTNGDIIGEHDGAVFYTIGERHGFRIKNHSINDKPMYVVSKNIEKNTITVAEKSDGKNEEGKEVKLDSTNWLSKTPLVGDIVDVRFRYRQELKKAVIKSIDKSSGTATISLQSGPDHIAIGQSAVMYVDDVCIGGGIISA